MVGFAVLEEMDGDVHLEQLSVHPSAMRRGIGAALLEAAVSMARGVGARRVTLLTYADVPWNAPWYARHGWEGTDDLGPELRALAAHEVELGLTGHGRRVAMARPVQPRRDHRPLEPAPLIATSSSIPRRRGRSAALQSGR